MEFTSRTNIQEWQIGSWYVTKDRTCLIRYEGHDGSNLIGWGFDLSNNFKPQKTTWGFLSPWIKVKNNEYVLQVIHKKVSHYINRPKKNKIYCDADKTRFPNVFKHTGFKIIKKEFFEKGEIWITNGKEIILWKFPEKQ